MKRCIALLAIGAVGAIGSLTACTSVSGISPTPDGHLTVTCFGRWTLVSWNHVRKNGVKEAKAYCSRYHKEMHEVSVHSEGIRGATSRSVAVVFDCL
jgi:hypothetical protein